VGNPPIYSIYWVMSIGMRLRLISTGNGIRLPASPPQKELRDILFGAIKPLNYISLWTMSRCSIEYYKLDVLGSTPRSSTKRIENDYSFGFKKSCCNIKWSLTLTTLII
jgi:hypothetical protein